VVRVCAGIWKCKSCNKTSAGGAYMLTTPPAATARSTISRMRSATANN
jgi:large subunit ribosomal protein L37Ae